MTLISLNQPYRRMNSISTLMDDLFENSIRKNFRTWSAPAANITSENDGFEIQLAAPGLKREDFKISVDDGKLGVSAEVAETNGKFTHREFHFGSFNRTFTLPENIAEDKISATYENGLLTITIPRNPEKNKSREIKIS